MVRADFFSVVKYICELRELILGVLGPYDSILLFVEVVKKRCIGRKKANQEQYTIVRRKICDATTCEGFAADDVGKSTEGNKRL